jgi:UPF0716 protein FxsA
VTATGPTQGSRPPAARLGLAGLLLLVLVELAVSIVVGRAIGAGWTVLLLLLLSVLGVVVLRGAAVRAVRSLSGTGPGGTVVTPRDRLRDGGDVAWTVMGGALLVVPGFVTAAAGLLLAAPPTRRLLRPLLGRGAGLLAIRLLGGPLVGRMAGARIVQGDVVQATVVDVEVVPPTTSGRAGSAAPAAQPRDLPAAPGTSVPDQDPPDPGS